MPAAAPIPGRGGRLLRVKCRDKVNEWHIQESGIYERQLHLEKIWTVLIERSGLNRWLNILG